MPRRSPGRGAGAEPGLLEVLIADARTTAAFQGARFEFRSRADALGQVVRLAWKTDAFFAQVLQRLAMWGRQRGVPILPWVASRWAVLNAQVAIAPSARVGPGLYLAHGQVRIGEGAELSTNVVIFPWATIGPGDDGGAAPTIGPGAHIGTGSQVVGPVKVGAGAKVGANAVVIDDVPARATAVGVPARVLGAER